MGGGYAPGAPLGLGQGATGAPGAVAPEGSRVALLAPLTGTNAGRGQALAQAAQLALSEPGSPQLDVHDTHSTPDGAAAAAKAALAVATCSRPISRRDRIVDFIAELRQLFYPSRRDARGTLHAAECAGL